jgi:hypothetical protein
MITELGKAVARVGRTMRARDGKRRKRCCISPGGRNCPARRHGNASQRERELPEREVADCLRGARVRSEYSIDQSVLNGKGRTFDEIAHRHAEVAACGRASAEG